MTVGEKNRLLDLLTETYSTFLAAVEGVDPEMQVYTDSDWRVRDVIWHLATWDRQVAKSLRAYQAGGEYSIPDFSEDEFNEASLLEGNKMTPQQIYNERDQAREDFKEAVREIPLDQFPGDLLYPWGDERGSIPQLVEYMAEHDVEHRDEILKRVASRED